MKKTNKGLLCLSLTLMIPMAVLLGTRLDKGNIVRAEDLGNYTRTIDVDSELTDIDFLDDYDDTDNESLCIDLHGHTWTINETVEPDSFDTGCLCIKNGYIKLDEEMEDETVFEITGGVEFSNVIFDGLNCDRLVSFTKCGDGWNRFGVFDCEFKNCSFHSNGGAFYFDFTDDSIDKINFINSDFMNCTTTGDGTIMYFNNAGKGESHKVNIVNCNFGNCHADGDGGAIYLNVTGIDIQNFDSDRKTVFFNCTADVDGGAIFDDDGHAFISDFVFYKCSSGGTTYGGGAICLDEAGSTVDNSEFYENSTLGRGSAIWCDSANCVVNHCIIENNSHYVSTMYFEKAFKCTECWVSNWINYDSKGVEPDWNGWTLWQSHEITESYKLSSVNYNDKGELCRGDIIDNPILITSSDDLKAVIMNLNIEDYLGGNATREDGDFYKNGANYWKNKYYALMTDIDNFYFRTERMQSYHFIGNGYSITTRFPESCLRYCDCYGLEEYGRNGYTYDSLSKKYTTWTNSSGEEVTGQAYIISNQQYIAVFKGGRAYVVTENVTYHNLTIKVQGDVCLVLSNNTTLTLVDGSRIELSEGNTLTISGSNEVNRSKMGKLVINAKGIENAIGTANRPYWKDLIWVNGHYIHGEDAENAGTLNLYGGRVILTAEMGAAFGGGKGSDSNESNDDLNGNGGDGGWLNIYGGWFTATSNWRALSGGSKGTSNREVYGWRTAANTKLTVDSGIAVQAGESAETATDIAASNVNTQKFVDIYVTGSIGTGTLMSTGSLVVIFGILSGVFAITAGVFIYLYFKKRKQENN